MNPKTSVIKAELRKTFFAAGEHLAITVDDETLDVMIDEFYPEDNFLGLIPTLLPLLENKEEEKLVWERIIPEPGKTKMVPMLMCPEDLDLTCTTLMIKVSVQGDLVVWEKFGLNATGEGLPQSIGIEVEWLTKLKPLYFKKQQYLDCINEFKKMHQ